ncbi:MAG TPA: c(7)-type cytochrome triheme domain-containing protein [Usitatibacter sp.]|nr:c(7)-type cytochrome triheme domain-containing protein [Usitatibacter sp.]
MASQHRWRPWAGRLLGTLAVALAAGMGLAAAGAAHAEYGDVVINNYADAAGVRPVVFPHWFHRVRFRCKVCHSDLGFKFQAGGNQINMVKIIDGQYCGACHNGNIAWSIENCDLCHSAKPGTPTQVHESTIQKLAAPAATATAAASGAKK